MQDEELVMSTGMALTFFYTSGAVIFALTVPVDKQISKRMDFMSKLSLPSLKVCLKCVHGAFCKTLTAFHFSAIIQT